MRHGTTRVPEAYVVDSSVVVRWYVDQPGAEHAREVRERLVAGSVSLVAPDICRWEVANVLRKKGLDAGLLTPDDVVASLTDLEDLGVVLQLVDLTRLEIVTALACRRRLSLFDAAFVELSLRTGLPLLTADARLARAVAGLVSTEVLRGVMPDPRGA